MATTTTTTTTTNLKIKLKFICSVETLQCQFGLMLLWVCFEHRHTHSQLVSECAHSLCLLQHFAIMFLTKANTINKSRKRSVRVCLSYTIHINSESASLFESLFFFPVTPIHSLENSNTTENVHEMAQVICTSTRTFFEWHSQRSFSFYFVAHLFLRSFTHTPEHINFVHMAGKF